MATKEKQLWYYEAGALLGDAEYEADGTLRHEFRDLLSGYFFTAAGTTPETAEKLLRASKPKSYDLEVRKLTACPAGSRLRPSKDRPVLS